MPVPPESYAEEDTEADADEVGYRGGGREVSGAGEETGAVGVIEESDGLGGAAVAASVDC